MLAGFQRTLILKSQKQSLVRFVKYLPMEKSDQFLNEQRLKEIKEILKAGNLDFHIEKYPG